MTSNEKEGDRAPASGAGKAVVLTLIVLAFGSFSLMATRTAFLRPAVLDANRWVFGVAWFGWLFPLASTIWKSSHSLRPARSPRLRSVRYGLTVLLATSVFACLSVVALDQVLLLAVRYGASEPVEFRSRVTYTVRTRGCEVRFAFFNEPLRREATLCGDDLPLFRPRAGDPIVVQEQVGALGGRVVLVRRHPSGMR